MGLPLHYLFSYYPSDYWLHRHPKIPANKFFVYDTLHCRLRPWVETEYSLKPSICRKLLKEILELRTVKVHSYIFDHIVAAVDEEIQLVFNLTSLVTQVKNSVLWLTYSSRIYRNLKIDDSISLFIPISEKAFKVFWFLPLLLQARSHWYRVISKKLPTAKYLRKIGTVPSTICRLCNSTEDSLDHFIVQCPNKNSIGQQYLIITTQPSRLPIPIF